MNLMEKRAESAQRGERSGKEKATVGAVAFCRNECADRALSMRVYLLCIRSQVNPDEACEKLRSYTPDACARLL
jgi:hypothetical protein